MEIEANLGFGNDFYGDLLAFELAFLELSGTSVPEMPSADLVSELVLVPEVLGEPEALIQPSHALCLAPLRYRRLVWLHRAVTSRQHSSYMLRRRRRRKRPLKEPLRRRLRAHIRRRSRRRLLREEIMRRAGTVEREERRFLYVLLSIVGAWRRWW